MQDSFGNPIPDPTADAAPETDAPVVETPTEAPAEPALDAETTPAETSVDTPAEAPVEAPANTPAEAPVEVPTDTPAEAPVEAPAEPAPAFDTSTETAPVVDAATPVEPAPAETPSSVIAPVGGEKKSNSGLIIGIIVAVLIIGIIAAVAFLFLNNNKTDDKKDDTTSETKEKESDNKKDDKKEEKKAEKGVKVSYDGTELTISTSFGDTVKGFAGAAKLYDGTQTDEDVEITDIDTYLDTVLEDEKETPRLVVLDEEEYGVFEINASTYKAKVGEDTYKDLTAGTIYFWPSNAASLTIDGHEITTAKTTEAEIKNLFGEPDETYDNDDTYTLDYKINGIMVTFFLEKTEDGTRVIDFVTFN